MNRPLEIPESVSAKMANMGFVCALLVVVMHACSRASVGSGVWWLQSMFNLRYAAVPYFFLASGFLLAGHVGEDGWWRRALMSRVRSLVIPFVAWSFLWVAALAFMQIVDNVSAGMPWKTDVGALVRDPALLGLNVFSHPLLEPLWFVRSLVLFVLFSPVLVWLLRRACPVLLLLLLSYSISSTSGAAGEWTYFCDRFLALGMLFFFALGMSIRMALVHAPLNVPLPAVALVCAIFWGTSSFLRAEGLRVPIFASDTSELAQLTFMLFLWRCVPERRLPPFFVQAAFPIYLSHYFVVIPILRYCGRDAESIGAQAVRFAACIGGTLMLVWLVRLLPRRVSSLLLGGR